MRQPEFLKLVDQKLNDLAIPYAIVGSYGCAAYGQPRFTQDIDMVVEYRTDQIESLLIAFPQSEFYLSRQGLEEGLRNHVPFNIIQTASGNKVDMMPVRHESWFAEQLNRRRRLELFPGIECWVASPEDVILGKLWYYQIGHSDKHLRDIAGILKLQQDQLDFSYLEKWVSVMRVEDIWQALCNKG